MFTGLSLLRQQEKKTQEQTEEAKKLQAYLASRYQAGPGEVAAKEKKRKKKKQKPEQAGGVRIIDEDTTGFIVGKAAKLEVEDFGGEEDEEEAPVVANPEEAEAAARLLEKERSGAATRGWIPADGDEGPAGDRQNGARPGGCDSDASPPRRRRQDSPDLSPARKRGQGSPDLSPAAKRLRGSPDLSPVRRRWHDTPDASPARRRRHDSEDLSPKRQQRPVAADSSPRRRGASPAGSDFDVPRRRPRHDSPSLSPPRKGRHDIPDQSPPRRGRHDSSDGSDLDAPRRRQQPSASHAGGHAAPVDADQSPPRKRGRGDLGSRPGRSGGDPAAAAGAQKAAMMSDGTVAGMVSGRELQAEMARKREQDKQRFASMGEQSGRNAETVYRDKTGKRVDEAELKRLQQAEKKPEPVKPEWGGGVKQMREAEQRRQEMAAAAVQPFARSRDDKDLDAMLRQRSRFGDPMAHLVKKRAGDELPPPVISQAMHKRMKKSGFVIPQDIPPHSWIKRNMGPPLNRYGIKPGRHWDGVDRSNGFEKGMFKTMADLAHRNTEARMWSQSDM